MNLGSSTRILPSDFGYFSKCLGKVSSNETTRVAGNLSAWAKRNVNDRQSEADMKSGDHQEVSRKRTSRTGQGIKGPSKRMPQSETKNQVSKTCAQERGDGPDR